MKMTEYSQDPRVVSLMEKRILDIIVKYSLYKDDQLNLLYYEFTKANVGIEATKIVEAIQNVKKSLDE